MQGFLFLHILRGRSFTPRLLEEKKTKRPFNMQNRVQQQPLLLPLLLLYLLWLCRIYISLFRGKNALSHQSWIGLIESILLIYDVFTTVKLQICLSFYLQTINYHSVIFFLMDRSSHQILKNLAAYPFFSRQASLVASSHHIFTD